MMKSLIRIISLVALLFVGSARTRAQDPFGEVDITKYSNTMTITGYVRLDGKKLGNETVVAVFQGDELRGKKSPFDSGSYTNILMMSIYGDTEGEPLSLKVWTNGEVLEHGQSLTFVPDKRLGRVDDPYYIDIEPPIYTTFNSDGWGTVCLPYDVVVPEDVTVWICTEISGEEVLIHQCEGSVLPQNTPVLVQSSGQESCGWLKTDKEPDIDATGNILEGTTKEMAVEPNSVLTLDVNDQGEACFRPFEGSTLPANSAYIADFPEDVTELLLHNNDIVTGITPLHTSQFNGKPLYDVLGRSMPQSALRRSTSPRILISKGKKILVR